MSAIPDEWSADTLEALREAGWFPGRNVGADIEVFAKRVESETGVCIFPSARKALQEFGGLVIRRSGPGVYCARASLQFDYFDFPSAESLAADRARAGKSLYAVGEIDRLLFLAIAEDGSAYALGDVPDDVQFVAASIYGAVEAVLQGRLPWMDPQSAGASGAR